MTTESQATTGNTPTDPGTQQPAGDTSALLDTSTTTAAPATEQQQQAKPEGGDAPADGTPEGQDGATTTDPNAAKPDDQSDDAGKATGAPEQYEDFVAPEGVQLDGELVGDLKTLAKELNLSQSDAQRVADLGPKLMQKLQNQQAEFFNQMREQWADQTRGDSELGGDAFEANLGVAKKALAEFGTPELNTLLKDTGVGNHPEMIRLLHRIGKKISSDSFVPGNSTAHAPQQGLAQKLYGNPK
ncbi:hypothetical protein [Bordetella genomosp. 1]|uniref:Peptidase n=1 Tax=Bordetella genomosp. 1 TaxID=1395607 RepID=A0ABX4EWA2_9BORD|nr:hypothetical protein [Bordetella genomosp. 1]OZI58714.1 hypothetical protein CAL27_18705 [Bordetella genomosp. 1]